MNAVTVNNISKHYRVYIKPADRLMESLTRKKRHQLVTALTDVSFEVPFGQTLGIIGENGAGKSTLLKILAGTVQPSRGELLKSGRVAALLELGSGFHPEFSGRGNIYLNAALLGLTEKEIAEKEASIIAFSELEDVIDLPVKTYSSGMYVRLAFAIATSVDPEVLIVDEALSVGDQRFQHKCIDRMMGFRDAGKTIILCSHSMYLVNELCEKCMWIKHGHMASYGKTSLVIAEYLAYLEQGKVQERAERMASAARPEVTIESLRLLDKEGQPTVRVNQFDTVRIEARTRRIGPPFTGHIGIGIIRTNDEIVFASITKTEGLAPITFTGEQSFVLEIPDIPIFGGDFRPKSVVADEHTLRAIDESVGDVFMVESERPEVGMTWLKHQWTFDTNAKSSNDEEAPA